MKSRIGIIGCIVLFAVTVFMATGFRTNIPTIEPCVDTVYVNNNDNLSKWELLILAMLDVESAYNEDPTYNGKCFGCMQISQVYITEINNKMGTHFTIDDTQTLEGSLDIFHAMNDIYNPDKDIDTAIRLHNKSRVYMAKVKKKMKEIEKYETFRGRVTDYYISD